jgi:hypothetical protein
MKRVLLRASRVVAVSTAGFTLVAIGIVLVFTPGPAILVIMAGLAVLATEYLWARRLRDDLLERVGDLRTRARARRMAGRIDGSHEDVPATDASDDRDDVPAA